MRTSEATPMQLNWAVTKCEEVEIYFDDGVVCLKGQSFDDNQHYWLPTQNWSQGGPIIEREKIAVRYDVERFGWVADFGDGKCWFGATPLIAAMRCYVASKLGDEVTIPEGLL